MPPETRRRALLAAPLLLALPGAARAQGAAAPGSQGAAAPGSQGAAAPGAPKRVVATFTVLADMARNVAGDGAVVESLTRPGAEIHDYDPTPGDVVRARAADLVLWNGLGLERWFERFFGRLEGVRQAVLSEGVEPVSIDGGAYAGRPNPHAWMSPGAALVYVENIRRALAELDPARAELFAANARNYSERLRALDARLRQRLGAIPANQRVLATCEGAFGYLTRDYGLREAYLWPINAEDEGTPRQVRALIDLVRRERPPAVFCESTVNDAAMRRVAREAGSRFGGVLHVDSLTADDGPAPTYLRLLESNADTILSAFAGGAGR